MMVRVGALLAALAARAAAAPRLRAAVATREARLEVVRGALRAGTLGLAARDAGEGGASSFET